MSYEYQVRVAELIEYHVLSEVEELAIQEELDHVYSIAKKVSKHNTNYKYLEENINKILAKAKAFDESLKGFKELERLHEEVRKVSKRNQEKSEVYKEMLSHVIREMESNLEESGGPYA